MTSEQVARHLEVVRELSKPGSALTTSAPNASTNNPDWWVAGEPTLARGKLHERLIEEARNAAPNAEQGRRAIVLAGPPGAGKSTVLNEVLGSNRDKFVVIDADEFKRALLKESQADGSYESWLKPDAIREREAGGDRFFPLELASLVHEESSYLARTLRADAIAVGDNIVIDTVLSNEADAVRLGQMLHEAEYDVRVIDVEVPFEVSAERIRGRWERAYETALEGGDSLGGRWVPSEYARDVFDGRDGSSKPEQAARSLAETCPAVSRYRVFRTTEEQARQPEVTPTLAVDLSRAEPGAQLASEAQSPSRPRTLSQASFPNVRDQLSERTEAQKRPRPLHDRGKGSGIER